LKQGLIEAAIKTSLITVSIFCSENEDIFNLADSGLSKIYFSSVSSRMSLSANVFKLCDRGNWAIWGVTW
jgi:hypothetical protein